jgi:hypothetical protein
MASWIARDVSFRCHTAVALLAVLTACGGQEGMSGNGIQSDGGDGGSAALHWFSLCGPPVAVVGDAGAADSGVAPCITEQEGDTCPSAGLECQPVNGTPLLCAAADPKLQTGGCPISSRRFKQDIRYLSDRDLERIAAGVEHIRLANYSYKSDPSARERLGFIIEDDPTSPAVAEGRTQIDLYGYTSMVVAAMKIQARKLEEQNAELGLLRRKIDALERRSASAATVSPPHGVRKGRK